MRGWGRMRGLGYPAFAIVQSVQSWGRTGRPRANPIVDGTDY